MAFEHRSPAATVGLHAYINQRPVEFARDEAAEVSLQGLRGSNWYVYTTTGISQMLSTSTLSSLQFDYLLSDRIEMPPDGSPLPPSMPDRIAVAIDDGAWDAGPIAGPITYDKVIVSFTPPRDARQESDELGEVPVRPIEQGHGIAISKVFLKSSINGPQTVNVQTEISLSGKVVRPIATVGGVTLGQYGLATVQNVQIPTEGLSPGNYILRVAARSQQELLGEKVIGIVLTPPVSAGPGIPNPNPPAPPTDRSQSALAGKPQVFVTGEVSSQEEMAVTVRGPSSFEGVVVSAEVNGSKTEAQTDPKGHAVLKLSALAGGITAATIVAIRASDSGGKQIAEAQSRIMPSGPPVGAPPQVPTLPSLLHNGDVITISGQNLGAQSQLVLGIGPRRR